MFYEEPAKKLPVSASVDVLVLGAGPAGVAAAISAGRQGAKTMLIEQLGDVGGIATSGLMSHWTGNTRGGIYEEFLDRSADLPDSADYGFNGSPRQLINPERLKTVFLQMLHEAHCEVLLYKHDLFQILFQILLPPSFVYKIEVIVLRKIFCQNNLL